MELQADASGAFDPDPKLEYQGEEQCELPPLSTKEGHSPIGGERGFLPFGQEFLVPRRHLQALSRAGTGSQRCQSPQALIRIVPTLLAGDGEMEFDRGHDPTRSQSHE